MKKLKYSILLLPLVCFIPLSGCISPTAAIQALGADTNSVVVDVTTVWGTVHVTRNMPYPGK